MLVQRHLLRYTSGQVGSLKAQPALSARNGLAFKATPHKVDMATCRPSQNRLLSRQKGKPIKYINIIAVRRRSARPLHLTWASWLGQPLKVTLEHRKHHSLPTSWDRHSSRNP